MMTDLIWVVQSGKAEVLYGPFQTAHDAGEWMSEFMSTLSWPLHIICVQKPWEMPVRKVD